MVYQINSGADSTPDEPFFGYRHYWSKSFGGAHLAAYEEGLALGQSDLEAGIEDGIDALYEIEHALRDLDWNAKVDGYFYATRSRGPSRHRH